LFFFLRDKYVPHNMKSRKKNYVFNLKKMRKEMHKNKNAQR